MLIKDTELLTLEFDVDQFLLKCKTLLSGTIRLVMVYQT
jgi:hypothetical protein